MNKSWILILIIFVIGLFGLYTIVETSTSVGHAIATIDDIVVTIPSGFTNFESHEKYIGIENRGAHEKIFFIHKKDGNFTNETFDENFARLAQSWDINIINNTTKMINNVSVKSVYYTNESENNTEFIESYFEGFNATYCIKTWNYDNVTRAESNIEFIIDTLHLDYKKPRK